jgi:hypothetical protein
VYEQENALKNFVFFVSFVVQLPDCGSFFPFAQPDRRPALTVSMRFSD